MHDHDRPIGRGALVLAALSCAAAACGGTEPDVPDPRFEAYVSGPANNSYEADVTVCQNRVEAVRTTVHLVGNTNGDRIQLLADDVLRAWVSGMAVLAVRRSGAGDLTFTIERDGEPVAIRRLGGSDTRVVLEASCHADGEP